MTITVADLKAHLNLTTDDDDALLAEKIATVSEWISQFIDSEIVPDMEAAPAPVREPVRQLAAHLYENREATLTGAVAATIPFGVADLIGPYRKWCF